MSPRDIPRSMRAMLLTGHGGLDRLAFRSDVAVLSPASREVLIEVGACGVNNTDLNTRTGWYDPQIESALTSELGTHGVEQQGQAATWDRSTMDFPRIQGAAIAGTVVAVGAAVSHARIGERVIVDPQVRDPSRPRRSQGVQYIGSERDGGYAEYVAVPAVNAHALESDLTDEQLATFPCSYETAEEMLERARLTKGETVLVTGASGGVGTALIQLAKLRGAMVIAVAGASKEDRVRELGADAFVPREGDSLADAVRELVGDRGVDVVADVVGGPTFVDMLRVLDRGGRYATGGAIAGPTPKIDLRDLIYKDLEMSGVANPSADTFARVVSYVASGVIKPLLEASFPLEDVAGAQRTFMEKSHVGKMVVVPRRGGTPDRREARG